MHERNDPVYLARAEFLKALAHPGRLRLVDLLSGGERCVCELAEASGYDVSTASRHLSQLKRAGIVSDRRQGTSVYYSLEFRCINELFRCMEASLRERLAREQAAFERVPLAAAPGVRK